MFMEPRDARVTSCRATGSNGEFLERTHYYESVSKSLHGNIEAIDMRLLSSGHRPGRLRRCTSSKCRTVFFRHLVAVFFGLLCVFVVYCVLLYVVLLWCMCFLWLVCCGFFVAFCVFCGMLLFLCCGMFAFVCRKRCWSAFFSRRGEGDNLLDAKCDSSEEEGGIAGASEPDRVVVVTGDSGICLASPPRCAHSKSRAQSFVLDHML